MRVLLTLVSSSKSIYSDVFGFRIPPLSVAYLAAIAEREGYDVKFVDSLALNLKADELVDVAITYDPDIVGFVMNSSTSHNASLEVARTLKRAINPLIISGGHHATFTYPLILNSGVVDLVVLGEGEETFRDILRRTKEGEAPFNIKGIAFREHGIIKTTGMRKFIENLDELPIPKYEIYQKELYGIDILESNAPVAPVETSRGCPYRCDFCSVTKMWGARWRLKSVDRVIEEIRRIFQLGFKWLFFVDDNFIVPTKTGIITKLNLLNKLRELYGREMKGIVQLRADLIVKNPWLINELKEAGIRISFLGIESGDPETLKRMRKGNNTDIGIRAVQLLSKAGIIVYAGFVLGAPYEDIKSIKRTIKYAYGLIKYGLDVAHFSIYTPLPGTDAFESAVRDGTLISSDFDLYDCLTPIIKGRVSPFKLFITQRFASYSYFIRKTLWSLRSRVVHTTFEKNKIKEQLIKNAVKYFARNIHKHALGFVMIPIEGIKITIRLKKGEVERRVLEDCVRAYKSVTEIGELELLQHFQKQQNLFEPIKISELSPSQVE
ncbi:MAG: radical SAM protein [Desulfurococcaceae archaeon]